MAWLWWVVIANGGYTAMIVLTYFVGRRWFNPARHDDGVVLIGSALWPLMWFWWIKDALTDDEAVPRG